MAAEGSHSATVTSVICTGYAEAGVSDLPQFSTKPECVRRNLPQRAETAVAECLSNFAAALHGGSHSHPCDDAS
ncbi:MAG: hypothetical protein ABUL60_05445 [Myxococcales bacterium]